MRQTIVILAIVLILFVLVVSVVLHMTGFLRQPQITQQTRWKVSVAGGPPETLKAIDLTGDGRDEVFAQTPAEVTVLSADGKVLLRQDVRNAKTTMGDLNGDGMDEFAVASAQGSSLEVSAYTAAGEKLWDQIVRNVGKPSRGTSLDFDGDRKREIVFGSYTGNVVCLNGVDGSVRWQYHFTAGSPSDRQVRGTDDAVRGGQTLLAVASYGGEVVLLDGDGEPVWQARFPQKIRRLRANDMDGDGTSEIMIGGLNGLIWLVSAQDGNRLWQSGIGSRVNEARFLELDGDPKTSELVVGSKIGGVMVFTGSGTALWERSVGYKVRELATLDYNGDGQNELLVAADRVFLLNGQTGKLLRRFSLAQATALDVGDFGKEESYVVGTRDGVAVYRIRVELPPIWWSPLLFGLLFALLIAVGAVVLIRMDWTAPLPKTVYTVQDMSLQALRARKKMLREVLEDVKRMQHEGELDSEAYLARSRQIQEQIADVEAKILEINPDYKPELMRCPSCGAPLEIGMDRCPYCNHVLL